MFEDLVCTARQFAEAGSNQAAYDMFGRALEMKPDRIELHIDVAELEYAAGDTDAANERLEQLASIYIEQDMLEEAQLLIGIIEERGGGGDREPGAVVPAQTGMTEPMTTILGIPQAVKRSHTELVSEPILLFPDGTPMPRQPPRSSRPGFRVTRTRPKPGQARFRVNQPPPAAKPRRPPKSVHKVAAPKPDPAPEPPSPEEAPVVEAKKPRKAADKAPKRRPNPPPVPGYLLNEPIAPLLRIPKEGTLASRLKKLRR